MSRYTNAETLWLIDKWRDSQLTIVEVAKEFSIIFPSHNVSAQSLWQYLKRIGITKSKEQKANTRKRRIIEGKTNRKDCFSFEEIEWIKDKWCNTDMFREDIAKEFNVIFPNHPPISKYGVGNLMRRHKFYRPNELKEEAKKNICYGRNRLPVGSELIKSGEVFIKVDSIQKKAGDKYPRNWIPKRCYEWEKINKRKLPFGWVVVPLDGDKSNYNPENLYACPRKVWSSLHFVSARNPGIELRCGKDWTKAYLLSQELKYVLEENSNIEEG